MELLTDESKAATAEVQVAALERALWRVDEAGARSARAENVRAYADALKQRLSEAGEDIEKIIKEAEASDEALESRASVLIEASPSPLSLEGYLRDIRSVVERVRRQQQPRSSESLAVRVRYVGVSLYRKGGVEILKNATGECLPGTMTLVLGPPAAGKSSFLKTLAGRADENVAKVGTVTYNGSDVYRKRGRPFAVSKIAAYVDQAEDHAPSLTVKETLDFARIMQAPIAGDHRAVRALEAARSQLVMRVFGIEHVQDTIIGNASLRGISGGQRRRVTLAEMLMGKAKIVACDEATTGLDSQTAYEIVVALRAAARVFNLTLVLALLQPPPEVFSSFDALTVLDAGRVIYSGRVDGAVDHFERLGFLLPDRKDPADFLVEIPAAADDLAKACEAPAFLLSEEEDEEEWPSYLRIEFPRSRLFYTIGCAARQIREIRGNPSMRLSKLVTATIVGLATGTLFYDLDYDDYKTKYGICFSTALYLGLGGFSAIPGLIERRRVFAKHRAASFYPTSAFVIADVLVLIPLLAVEAVLFTNLVYWLSGLATSAYGGYLLGVYAVQFTMTLFFGAVAAFAPTAQLAQPLAGLVIVLCVLFSGFIIARTNIPDAWLPVYWVSPIAWGLRTLLVNEFRSPRYDKSTLRGALPGCGEDVSDGVCFLKQFDYQHQRRWYADGLMVLGGTSLVLVLLQIFLLEYCQRPPARPPRSVTDDDRAYYDDADVRGTVAHKNRLSRQRSDRVASSQRDVGRVAASMPFEEVTLKFDDVSYYVPQKKKKKKQKGATTAEELRLLDGVSAYSKPGEMTALMGSSGAGKTTLLDCVAGRKTGGRTTGRIYLNDEPKRQTKWLRISGYVEQLDVHSPGTTVREAVDFSANLRLVESSAAKRRAYCDAVMSMLELTPISDRVVGHTATGGITFEQRKRLTLAIEMAANPSILFLDEPTSGLDSRAALVVVRAVKNVALTRRTVVCTVHQPSYALFQTFDRLLLLKTGGKTVYFGDLNDLVAYLQTAARTLGSSLKPLGKGENPATWMLSAANDPHCDFAAYYNNSDLKKSYYSPTVEEEEEEKTGERRRFVVEPTDLEAPLLLSRDDTTPVVDKYATTSSQQFYFLAKKLRLAYWRSPTYNVSRAMVSVVVALIFGSCFMGSVDDVNDAIGRSGLFFVSTFFMGLIFMNTTMPVIAAERAAFYREQASSMYRPHIYSIAFFLAELPYLVFFSFLFVSVLYGLVDMYGGAAKFFWYLAFYLLFVSVFCFFGQLLVVCLPDVATAQACGPPISSLFSLFSGYVIAPNHIPKAWLFMHYISPVHYVLEGMVATQFHDVSKEVLTGLKYVDGYPTPWYVTLQRYMSGHYKHSNFGGYFVYSHRFLDLGVLLGLAVAFRIITTLALVFLRYETR
ncbi:hypothetical protein CTAYLR_009793 [Chrysophaeum taylorii]|uniref:ABC transporter domain-containing protein n=1 Tax=Chrysophaeum taylorii TaxID=2483200 RepID=A0AAD7UN40_9STRA|nr:hypothetical protein CTAYLR_009793 [Chrysophaeum taylorii]